MNSILTPNRVECGSPAGDRTPGLDKVRKGVASRRCKLYPFCGKLWPASFTRQPTVFLKTVSDRSLVSPLLGPAPASTIESSSHPKSALACTRRHLAIILIGWSQSGRAHTGSGLRSEKHMQALVFWLLRALLSIRGVFRSSL